ncbi:MAG: hypothetical protein IPP14_05675 [Planctomycetes bacterium]|nr:hypothetical protein [Planctomycetota bacterium]
MSIVSCGSCGMQFNAAGYEPGVQFQCTQCGAMVTVGAPAAPARGPGGKKPTGVQRKGLAGPARGAAPARAAGPARGPGPRHAGSPAQVMGQGQQQGGPAGYAPKKNNALLFVGLGVGGVVVAIIIAVVVMATGPSPEDKGKAAAQTKFDQAKADQEKRDAEVREKNDAVKRTLTASMDRGTAIESALKNGDKATLEGMFDWTVYAAYVSDLAKGEEASKFLASGPMFSTGEWEKSAEGKYTGKWLGKAPHGPESLKSVVMGYIEKHLFGSPDIKWDKAKSEILESGFSKLIINGKEYMGKKIFVEVRGAGKTKEFWVGAVMGDDAVKVINFRDPSALTTLQQEVGKSNRTTTDDRNPIRDDRDPTVKDPNDPGPGPDEPEGPDQPLVEDLPAVAKTNAMPNDAALVNVVKYLSNGDKLKPAQKQTITTSKAEEKKAMLGALIDALIDAHKGGKRREKAMISDALFAVWGNFARNEGYAEDDMVYAVEGNSQSDSEDPIKRWIAVYNKYPSK